MIPKPNYSTKEPRPEKKQSYEANKMSEKARVAAVGIYLGATYSCVAVSSDKHKHVEIIPNKQGKKYTPLCIGWDGTQLLVGHAATRNPKNAVFNVKRLMGSIFSDKIVQKDVESSWPFKVIEGPEKKPMLVIEHESGNKQYSYAEVYSMILKILKEDAEAYLEMDLFAFICHSDPTKVWIRESELAKREVGLLKMTKGCTVSLSPPATTAPEESGDSIEKLFDVVDQEHAVEKSDDVLEGMVSNGSAIPSGATDPLVDAFVAPVSDTGPLDFVFRPNLQTRPPHVRSPTADAPVVMVNVTTTVDADVGAGSKAKDVSKDFENIGDSTSAGGSLDTETMHRVHIPRWKVTNDSTHDDPYLYYEFNVGAARQVCIRAEVRMRAKHNLERKCKLEEKDYGCCQEAVEAISLRSQLFVIETADAAKSIKLRDLKEENFALEGEISALSERVTTFESVTTSKEAKLASLSS
nr:putative heat shock protein 70 family, peptide-binding domain protein [Tanacetum cinerariifolium]